MANRNTNPGIGETTDSGVCGYIVLRVLQMAKWDDGFLKFALRASRRI